MESALIKAIIVDDEPHCVSSLSQQLKQFESHVSVIGTSNSAMRGLKMINDLQPNLVFLDISMPGGTGFEMLDQLKERSFEVVFTSAHKDYAINAFDYQVFNFLLKPIDEVKLKQVIKQLILKQKKPHSVEEAKPAENKLYLHTQKGHQVVSIDKIIRCEADGGYTYFYIEGGGKFMSSQNIKTYEEELKPYAFCRIHKKHLINLKRVKYFTKGKGGHVTLSDGSEVSISYRQKTKFLNALQKKSIGK